MKDFHLYLDSADEAALSAVLPHPLVHGVTTNPTLCHRAGVSRADLPALLHRCIDTYGVAQVQAQVGAADCAGMLADAERLLAGFDPGRLVIKLPATREGMRAGAQLAARRVPVTYTAVYTPEQAFFAAQLGAAYAAPYLGRLDDSGLHGLGMIARMHAMLQGRETRLLVASVRSREAFLGLLELGVGAVTLPPALFAELLDQPDTLAAERTFLADAAR